MAIPHSIKKGHGGEGQTPVRSMRRGSKRMQAAKCCGGGKELLENEKVSQQCAEEKLKGHEGGRHAPVRSMRRGSVRTPAVRY